MRLHLVGIVGLATLLASSVTMAQEVSSDQAGPRVARLSLMTGDVSVRRGDSEQPVAGALNAPLLAGDALVTGPAARAEVQFDFANRIRLGNRAEARIAAIEDGHFRVEVAVGTVTMSVLRDSKTQGDILQGEIGTPNVAVRGLRRGDYRVWVRDDGQTVITVRQGEAEVFTEKGTERIDAGYTMFVRGTAQDPEFQVLPAAANDEWDTWNDRRDGDLDHVRSYQYVNPSVYGVEDLDANGSWSNDPSYGQVWTPRVDPDWAPYTQGRWAWEDYYGWTWVDSDPWGWAPFHYGSWYRGSLGWSWYPGALYGGSPVFWRPALVAFFGFGQGLGGGFGFGGFGGVGWCPLAPYEAFHPWYGRGGGTNINITNVNITNVYRNAQVRGAVSGVSANSFVSGKFSTISRVQDKDIRMAGLVRGGIPLTPSTNNLRFSDRQTAVAPRALNNRSFVSRTPVTAVNRVPFAQQQQTVRSSGGVISPSSQIARTQSEGQLRPGAPQNQPSSAWQRFGSPNRGSNLVSPPINNRGQSGAPSGPTNGWDRFGHASGQGTSGNIGPARSQVSPYSSQESLRLSQPLIHNRSYDSAPGYGQPAYRQPTYSQPAYNRPSYNPPPSYSRPSYSSPQPSYSRPSYSAPQPSYSRPSYNSPQPSYNRPSYSAPQPGYSRPSYSSPQPSYSRPSYNPPSSRSVGSAPQYSAPRSAAPSSGGGSHPSNNNGGGHHGR